ncbi:16277_t:CDS:2 [Entrophospora sp. SA101]|nr:16277_t:CDS:2 [Entrophospora sp. SA101]CAJ0898384.1 13530_t:CDS:2 [Entrophospora sp. SA101]
MEFALPRTYRIINILLIEYDWRVEFDRRRIYLEYSGKVDLAKLSTKSLYLLPECDLIL